MTTRELANTIERQLDELHAAADVLSSAAAGDALESLSDCSLATATARLEADAAELQSLFRQYRRMPAVEIGRPAS